MKKILDKYFRVLCDYLLISKNINSDEIIIRTLLQPKHISEGSLNIVPRKYDQYFLQLNGGVSVDRYRYQNENQSKIKAKKDFKGNQSYIGFAVFDLETLQSCLLEYRSKFNNPNFKSIIIPSPLNKKKN